MTHTLNQKLIMNHNMQFGQNINVNFHSNQQFPIDAKYYHRLELQDYMQEASEFKTNEICFVTSD